MTWMRQPGIPEQLQAWGQVDIPERMGALGQVENPEQELRI
jgi:hypothetical protein